LGDFLNRHLLNSECGCHQKIHPTISLSWSSTPTNIGIISRVRIDRAQMCFKTLFFLHECAVQLALFYQKLLIILSQQILIKRRLLIILCYYLELFYSYELNIWNYSLGAFSFILDPLSTPDLVVMGFNL
jgi:hypothetical protein